MIKVKRFLPLLLSACMVFTLFAACGDGKTDGGSGNNQTGNTEGGNTEGGNTEGGNTEGGNTEGGNTEGGNTEGGNTEGGNTEGGNTEGGNTEGGNTEGGNTEGGNTEGGNTEGGNTEGGNTEGGNTEGGDEEGGEDVPSVPLAASKKIYVVGDSTVCSFNDSYYLPRYGYGTQLYNYLNVTESQVVNLALSGRSSKSFLAEANYTTLKNSIGEGDYLIIGFGHNDEKSDDAARFTDPEGSYTEAATAKGDSFQYVLYENYVKLAQKKGATPILCTPIVRYDSSGAYTGAKVHDTEDGDYSAAIRELGEATQTTVIDLTELTKSVYKADNAEAIYYHAHTTYIGTKPDETPDGRDDTHINMYGARMVAYQFACALDATDNPLAAHVKDDIAAPTKAADYAAAINQSHVKPDYTPFDPSAASDKWNISAEGWYGTAMGDIGGASVSPFTVSESGGTFTVGNSGLNSKGKFSGSADGFAAAFMQIDITKNFTASATVTIKEMGSVTNQSGFGMMLRDDILIDKQDTTLASNYVAAGALASGGGAIFSRENGALAKERNAVSVAKGAVYSVSIERVGQVVTVEFTDGSSTYTNTYTDFDFAARDNAYMYLCLFANRSIVAEFTDVVVTITGDAQGA